MNAKKITALVLAAMMAVGTSVTAFADSAVANAGGDLSATRPLAFADATIYEDKDGVLTPSTDYRPGDTLYIRLKEYNADTTAGESVNKVEEEKEDMKVYADWKVGKDAVEDVSIIYDKGYVKYSFAVDGVEFVINAEESLTAQQLHDAIVDKLVAYMSSNPDFLKTEVANELANHEKTTGYVEDGKWVSGTGLYEYAAGRVVTGVGEYDTGKVYLNNDADGAAGFVKDVFVYDQDDVASGDTIYVPNKNGFSVGYIGTSDVHSYGDSYRSPNVSLTGTSGDVYVINVGASYTARVGDLINAGLVAVNTETIVADANNEIKNVSAVTEDVYVDEDDVVITESEATADAIKAVAEAQATTVQTARAGLIQEYNGDWTYWVEIKTKDDDTTKVLDLAGLLYIGTSKTKAEKSNNVFQLDTSMDNRVYANGNYVTVVDEWTFAPNSRSVVKFDDEADDVVLYFGENEDAWFEVDARGQSALNLEFTFDFNREIADLFPNANINFLTFTSEPSFNRTGDLYIVADADSFIYEVTENGVKEIANAEYDEDEEAWVIRTRKLAAYAISDRELDTTKTLDGETSSSTGTTTDGGKDNPDTGR